MGSLRARGWLCRGRDSPPFPYVLGSEGAGVVAAIGGGVADFEVGDHVFAASFLNPMVVSTPSLCASTPWLQGHDHSRVRSNCPRRGLAVGSYCALGGPFVTTGPDHARPVHVGSAFCDTCSQSRRPNLDRRDVLVDAEEVVRIVLSLQGLQPVVLLRPVRLLDSLRTLIAQEVHIDTLVPRA